jgi:hypothetical protein
VRAFEHWGDICKKGESSGGISEVSPYFYVMRKYLSSAMWPQVELHLGYRHHLINNGAYSCFLFLSCLSSPSLFIKHHNTFITYSLNSESMHIISITFKTLYKTYSVRCIKGAYQIKANIISYTLKTILRKAWH